MRKVESIIDLKLPEGSKCIALTTLEPLCVVGAFDVPDEGFQVYVINPNTRKIAKVELPESFYTEIL